MGIGDWLMVSGEARRRAAGTARKFRVLDKRDAPYWHFVFEPNPNIARLHEKFDGTIGFVNRHRPYIVDETKQQRTFREYRPAPAPVALAGAHAQGLAKLAAGAIVFHASIKPNASPNKDWGWARWEALIAAGKAKGLRWLQLGEPGARTMPGVEQVATAHFWDAVALLAGARAAVLHEGGLHHAAAAVGTPAVVLYGGYIGPRVTGYDGQAALFHDTPEWPLGCGMRVPCEHCAQAMAEITPERVLAALGGLLAAHGRAA